MKVFAGKIGGQFAPESGGHFNLYLHNHILHDSLGGLSPIMFKQKNQLLHEPPPEEARVNHRYDTNELIKKSTFV